MADGLAYHAAEYGWGVVDVKSIYKSVAVYAATDFSFYRSIYFVD